MDNNDIYGRFRRSSEPVRDSASRPPARSAPQMSNNAPSPAKPPKPPRRQKSKHAFRRFMAKYWAVVGIFLVALIVAGGLAYARYQNSQRIANRLEQTGTPAPPEQPRYKQQQAKTSIRLTATGDMIAHDTINDNAKKADGSYDYAALMSDMRPFFDKNDINFCNQATPAGGEAFGYSGYPSFNAPVDFARGLEGVGCNLINLGTNHTNDKGQALIDATVAAWDNREGVLAAAGANRSVEEQKKPRRFTVEDITFEFLSYTTYTNKPINNNFGINRYQEETAKAEVKAAQENADIVIVSMRWGTEYSPDVNAQQDQIAKVLADAGADVVFGHGPHSLQPVKTIKASDGREVPVWFSLGNFLNSQLDIETLIGGFAVMDIDIASKKISSVGFMPVYQHYEWTAEQAQRRNNTDLLARRNFQMVPLDKAADLLAKSHHSTTVEAQTERVKQVLNKYTKVPIIESSKY